MKSPDGFVEKIKFNFLRLNKIHVSVALIENQQTQLYIFLLR